MATLYKDANEAGREARRSGQGIRPPEGATAPNEAYLRGVRIADANAADLGVPLTPQRAAAPARTAISTPNASAPSAPAGKELSIDDITKQVDQQIFGTTDMGKIQSALSVTMPEQQSPEKPEGNFLKDSAIQLGVGALNVVQSGYEMANVRGLADEEAKRRFGITGTEAFAQAKDKLRSYESDAMKAERKKLEESDGFIDSAAKVLTSPRLIGSLAFEMGPQLLGVAAAARKTAAMTMARVTEAELAAGKTAEEAAKLAQAAASRNATRTVMGLNAAMEGSYAASDARTDILTMSEEELGKSPQYQDLVRQYGDTKDGRELARQRLANDASSLAFAIAAPISALSGKLTGASELESRALTTGITRGAGEVAEGEAKRGVIGTAKELGGAALKESGQEAIEEGGSTFATNVGEKVSGARPDKDVFEGVPQAAGAAAGMAMLMGPGFKGMEMYSEAKSEKQKQKALDTLKSAMDEAYKGDDGKGGARSLMPDADFGSALNSQAYMVGLYNQADEQTRAKIAAAVPYDIAEMANDATLQSDGRRLASLSPFFNEAFLSRLNTPAEQATGPGVSDTPAFDPDTGLLRSNMPVAEQMRVAKDLAEIGMAEAEGQFSRSKRADQPSPESLNAGPEVQMPNLPAQDVLIRGYQRRAENLMSMPEGARRAAAESSMQEMISRGFTPEQAQSVFGRVTNPQAEPAQVQDFPPPPSPAGVTIMTDEGNRVLGEEDIRPKLDPNFQTFAQVRERMAQRDQQREPASQPTDYLEMPVAPQIRDLAKAMGVQVYGVRYTGKNATLKKRHGVSLSGGVIVLNADAQDQHLAIFGHELYHELRRRNPEAAAQLEQEVLRYVQEDGKEDFKKRLEAVGYQPGKFDEEMVADLMGVMLTEPQFWAQIGQSNPSLLQKIIQVIDDMIAKFGKLTNRKEKIAGYVTDMQKVRDMLAQFVNESQAGTTQSESVIDDAFDLTTDQEDALGKAGKLGAMNRVVDLVRQGNISGAAKVFKDSNLRGIAGISFTDVINNIESRLYSSQETLGFLSKEDKLVLDRIERMKAAEASNEQTVEQPVTDDRQQQLTFVSDEERNRIAEFDRRYGQEQERQAQIQSAEAKGGLDKAAPPAEQRISDMARSVRENPPPSVVEQEMMRRIEESRAAGREAAAANAKKNRGQATPFVFSDAFEQNWKEYEFKSLAEQKFSAALRKKGDRSALKVAAVYDIRLDKELIGRIYDVGTRGGSSRFGMVTIDQKGDLSWAVASTEEALVNRGKRLGEVSPTSSGQQRTDLGLKRDINHYDGEVARIMSGMDARLRAKINERLGKNEKLETQEDTAAEEGGDDVIAEKLDKKTGKFKVIKRRTSLLENDQGGVFGNMALSGVYGKEGFDEAESNRQSAEERANKKEREDAERAAIMVSRVRNLLRNADKQLNALQGVRERMVLDGYSDDQINATVGKAERELNLLRDADVEKFIREGVREIGPIFNEDGQFRERNEPEEYPGSNEIQAELDLNDQQRTDARRLVDAIAKGEISLDKAIIEVRKNDIGLMHLYDQMREAGMDVKKPYIDISGNIAVNFPLNDYVNKFPTAGMAAREAWLRAYDNLPIKGAVELSLWERDAYSKWKEVRDQVQRRRRQLSKVDYYTDDKGKRRYTRELFDSLEDAFPQALFLNYTLSEMRDLNRVEEPTRSMFRNMFDDPVRAWMKDIQFVLSVRPDFKEQLGNYLTKTEMQAYNEFAVREAKEARRALDMKLRSPAYSQLDGLRYLSPDLYMNFRTEIGKAEETQLSVILQEAQRINDLAKAAKESGEDIGQTIDDYLVERMMQDEQLAQSPDQMDDDIQFDEDGKELPPKSGVRFRRGLHSGVVPALTIAEHFERMFTNWDTQPAYTVVQNPNQLPDDVRIRLTSRFKQNGFKGAIDPKTGHIYVFSDFAESVEDAEFTMFHELFGHWGMRAFLGDSIDSFLKTQLSVNQKVREAADVLQKEASENGMPMTQLEAIEEAIADLAVDGDTSLFRQMLGRLVSWLRKHGMTAVADWMDSKGTAELAHVLSQARQVAMSKQGISPLAGAPTEIRYNRTKNMPVEAFATRNGKVAGYARMNPVTSRWTVFTVNGDEALQDGNYSIETVDYLSDAHGILRKKGEVHVSKDRETRQFREPKDVMAIPDFKKDLGFFGRLKRYTLIQAQNMFLPIFEVARWLDSKGVKNSVIDDFIKYESRLQYYVQDYERQYLAPVANLLKSIGKKGGSIEDVDLFMLARHAKERNQYIQKINPKNKSGSGISTKDAQNLLNTNNGGAWADYRAEMDEMGKLLDKMSKAKLAYMKANGLISEYQYRALSHYKHYVNLSGNNEIKEDEYDGSALGGRAFNVRGSDIIAATGRRTQAVDVLQNTMNSYLSALIRGQKNVPLQSVLGMFEQNHDTNYVRIEPISYQKKVNWERLRFDNKVLKAIGAYGPSNPSEINAKIKSGQITPEQANNMLEGYRVEAGRNFLKGLKKQLEDGAIDTDEAMDQIIKRINEAEESRDLTPQDADRAIRNLTEQGVIEGALNHEGYVSTVEKANPDKYEVIVKVNGKPVKMVFVGRGIEFFQSITGMNIQNSGDVLEAMGAWNRFFSQMVTTWNPAWIPVNMMRDVQTAIANMSADPEVGPVLAAKMMKEWARSGHTAWKYMLSDYAIKNDGFWGGYAKNKVANNPLSAEERQLMEDFYKDGAGTFFLDRNGLEQTLDKLNQHLNPIEFRKIRNGKDAAIWTQDRLSVIGDAMEMISMPVEIAPRFAVYKVLREHYQQQGMSEAEARSKAARYAKELTVNFNMKGASKFLRNAFVFFNPAIQGTMRMFQNYSREGSGGLGKLIPSKQFLGTASVFIGLGMMATMIARTIGGGDDDDKPGMDKMDMVQPFRRSTSLVFLPDVYGGSIPVAYGWNVFSTIGSYLPDILTGKAKPETAAAQVMRTAFDAFAPIGSGAESKSFVGMVAKTALPSPLVPLAEIAMKENRFGAPIYKSQSAFSDIEESDAYMHFETVNPISKWMMHSLAELTSGGKNPRYNESLVDVNPATVDHMLTSYLPGIISEVYKAAGMAITAASGRDTKPQDAPLISRFRAKVDEEAFDQGAFRRVKTLADSLFKEYTATDTSEDRKREIAKKYPEFGAVKALVDGLTQDIKKMRSELQVIDRLPGVTEPEKVKMRNEVEKLEKEYRNRALTLALQSGFRDAVVNDSPEK